MKNVENAYYTSSFVYSDVIEVIKELLKLNNDIKIDLVDCMLTLIAFKLQTWYCYEMLDCAKDMYGAILDDGGLPSDFGKRAADTMGTADWGLYELYNQWLATITQIHSSLKSC